MVITAGFLASHAPRTHEQPVWPLAWRSSLSVLYESDLRGEVIAALFAVGAAVMLAITRVAWRRARWQAQVFAVIILAFAEPHRCSLQPIRAATSHHPPSSQQPRSCMTQSCTLRTALPVMARRGVVTARLPNAFAGTGPKALSNQRSARCQQSATRSSGKRSLTGDDQDAQRIELPMSQATCP